MKRNVRKEMISKIVIHTVLIMISITMLVPFLWMILTAFKTNAETVQVDPFVIFPAVWRTEAFEIVMKNMDFLMLYKNTLLFILFRVLCAVVTASLAGYAFGRLEFKGRNFAFGMVVVQMMIPTQIFIIPQYQMITSMGMNNTIFALVFPGIVTAFGTFLMRQAYKSLPADLEEAARIDGCNIGQTFLHIMAPLTKSGIVALGIFTAVFAYKDLMWPMIINTDKNALVLSSALAKMQGQYSSKYPEMMAAALIACIPMIIIYILFQKQFIEGIATSGGKL
jgi:ABC-type sugar transport system, permease component